MSEGATPAKKVRKIERAVLLVVCVCCNLHAPVCCAAELQKALIINKGGEEAIAHHHARQLLLKSCLPDTMQRRGARFFQQVKINLVKNQHLCLLRSRF